MIDKILRSATRRKLSARKENCSKKDDRVIGLIVASKRGSSRERESRCGGRALRSSDSAATVKRQGKGFQPLHASVNRSKEKEVKAMRVVTGRLTRSAVGLTEQGSSRPVRIRRKTIKSEDEGKGGKASSAPSLLSNETVPPRRRGRPKKTPPPSLPPISASISSLKQRTSRSVPNGNREKRKILKFKGGRKREKAMESRDKWSLYRSRINKLVLILNSMIVELPQYTLIFTLVSLASSY